MHSEIRSIRTRHRLTLIFTLVLLPLFGALRAASDPTPAPRVWVSDHKTLRAIDTATHQIAATIPLHQEAKALAIDSAARSLWALTGRELLKFNEQGDGVLRIDLNRLGAHRHSRLLALNPYDGSVWIGGHRSLLRLNADGTPRLTFKAEKNLRDIALDIDESLWALTQHTLVHLNVDGTVRKGIDLKAMRIKPRRLAVDSLGGWVW